MSDITECEPDQLHQSCQCLTEYIGKLTAERDALRVEITELKATVEFRTKVMEDNVTYCNGLEKEKMNLQAERDRYKQALEAIWFGSLEANFKQCLQSPQEIAKDAITFGEKPE